MWVNISLLILHHARKYDNNLDPKAMASIGPNEVAQLWWNLQADKNPPELSNISSAQAKPPM